MTPLSPFRWGGSGARDCDEGCCEHPWARVVAAFAGGAAPVVVTYLIHKLDPAMMGSAEDEEEA